MELPQTIDVEPPSNVTPSCKGKLVLDADPALAVEPAPAFESIHTVEPSHTAEPASGMEPAPGDVPPSGISIEPSSTAASSSELSPARTPSPFFRLPPELRNRAYKHVLPGADNDLNIDQGIPEPDLLLVCKRIRGEARPMFYNGRTFVFRNAGFSSDIYLHIESVSDSGGRTYVGLAG